MVNRSHERHLIRSALRTPSVDDAMQAATWAGIGQAAKEIGVLDWIDDHVVTVRRSHSSRMIAVNARDLA